MSTLYRSPEEWGEEYVQTMEQWEKDIPESEEKARVTCFHDWFLEQEEEYNTWGIYRESLMRELEMTQ